MKKFLAAFLLTISITTSGTAIIYAENISDAGSAASENSTADISSTAASQPAGNADTAGKKEKGLLREIIYNSDDIYEEIHINTVGYSDYSTKILTDPDRIVIDLKNVNVPGVQGSIQAAGRFVNRIRYSQFTANTARVVLDVKKGYDYSVQETDTGLTVFICKERTANSSPPIRATTSGSLKISPKIRAAAFNA
jgi:hypothetical protein